MLPCPHNPDPAQSASERRRAGRIKTPGVVCAWGEVADISCTGLRVLHKGSKPVDEGTTSTLTIRSRLSAFPVDVRVVRVTKLGFRKWQLGIEILQADEKARKELTLLARAAAQGGSVYH